MRLFSQWGWMRHVAGMLLLAAMVFAWGCESGDGAGSPLNQNDQADDGGGGDPPPPASDNQFVGVWALYAGDAIEGDIVWYITFRADSTYAISNNADGTGQRVHGTYTPSGSSVTGPFVNPRVGDGRIDAVLVDGKLDLDFIEYWHTPHKVVPYYGTKM